MNQKWVAAWGNAMSIAENRPEGYAKDITLRYNLYTGISGEAVRLTFDNYCGTEEITITKATILYQGCFYHVCDEIKIPAGEQYISDPIPVEIDANDFVTVSIYLGEFTQMRSAVYIQGPLSNSNLYAIGDQTEERVIDIDVSKKTNMIYFLSNMSVLTKEDAHTIICYGDSITAQDWPDYLSKSIADVGNKNTAIIRRATSGSRILREYDCITYNSYGLKATNRFPHEAPTDGADMIIIQQGINDIIHPVGVEVNPFRPMSDLPTAEELIEGLKYYISEARKLGYKVFVGTLLPIEGWRTYADFRESLRNDVNNWIRTTDLIDGCIDFDLAVRNKENPPAFADGYDSGDHLHPSSSGYKAMADAAMNFLLSSQ